MKIRSALGRIFLFALVVVVLDMVGAVVVGTIEVRRAAGSLDDAATALRKDDVAAASELVARATASASSARELTGHPGFRLLHAMPFTDRDADAFESLVTVSERGATAADRVVSALTDIGASGAGIIDAIYADGTIDLEALGRLADATAAAASEIEIARSALDGQDARLGPLARALDRAEGRLRSVAAATGRGLKVARVLPGMLGADEGRSYLLAFQSPSEARGGGGLIGVYGLLSAVQGRISLDHVGPIEELGPRVHPPVSAPPDFAQLYGPLSALRDWRQANQSPNFPATSSVLLKMYERTGNQPLDGVIALDPIALGELTRATGPLTAEGWGKTITHNNARRVLLFQIYKHFVDRERVQNAYLRGLVEGLWNKVDGGDLDAAGLVEAMNTSSARQHLKVYSSHPDEQALLTELGVAADPSDIEEPMQLVYNNNNSGNKLDFFLRRHQSVDVSLFENGGAEVHSSVALTNDVPRKGLRAAARSGVRSGLRLGDNRMSLHFMLPRGSEVGRLSIPDSPQRSYSGMDDGYPVEWMVLQIAPEETVTAELVYTMPDAVRSEGDRKRFEFTLWPQATARPDSYEVTVTAPPGYVLAGPKGGTDVVITVTGTLKQPLRLSYRVIPAGDEG
jgi:hypothetical protein